VSSIARRTCSDKFRNEVAYTYPGLFLRKSYWRMMEYILFGTYRDEDDKSCLVIDSDTLARIEGKTDDFKEGNYCGEIFLSSFSKEVLPISWSRWNYKEGKARVLYPVHLPDNIKEARKKELSEKWAGEKRVYFIDGSTYNRSKAIKEREGMKLEALSIQHCAGNIDARDILGYLNNLPPNKFTSICTNMPAAYAKLATMDLKEETVIHQILVLRAINDQAQPFYQPSSRQKTVRVFGLNESMLQLKKDIRRALTPDWIDFDLSYAQVAINAMLWKVEEVQKFLRSGENLWKSLFAHLVLTFNVDTKKILKQALYSLCYGMGKRNIVKNYFSSGHLVGLDESFFSHPVIKALYNAREIKIKEIQQKRGEYDIYHRWISLDDNNIRSILSQLAQAVELKIIHAAYELAKSTDQFDIVLHQHDGFSVSVRNYARRQLWAERIEQALLQEIDRLGVVTRVEIEGIDY
jgi:hypothetical protein